MKLKKILAGLLTVTTLFSAIPMTSFASGFNNNAGGGGGSTAGGNGMGGNASKTLYSETSGYRITLVNPNTGETESKSIDILFSPLKAGSDIYISSRVEDADRAITMDEMLKNPPSTWDYMEYSKLVTMLRAAGYSQIGSTPAFGTALNNSMPMWFNRSGNQFSSDGNAFREWFLPESSLDLLSGIINQIIESANIIKTLDVEVSTYRNALSMNAAKIYEIYKTKQSLTDMETALNEMVNDSSVSGQLKISTFKRVCELLNGDEEFLKKVDVGAIHLTFSKPWGVLCQQYPDLVADEHILIGGYPFTATSSKTSASIKSIFDLFTMTAYAAPSDNGPGGSVGNTGSDTSSESTDKESGVSGIADLYMDEAKTIFNVDKYGWALAILRLEEGGKGIFAKGEESGQDMVRKLLNGEAYILVEPILFFKPQTTINLPTYFYGTPWNYTSDSYVKKLQAFDGTSLSGGNIFRGPNLQFFVGLQLARNEEELAGEKSRTAFLNTNPFLAGSVAPPSTYSGRYTTGRYRNDTYDKRSTHDLLSNTGLGMQLYAVGKGTSRINTYDIIGTPKNDWTTETSEGKPSEDNSYVQANKNRTFQIAKFYRVKIGSEIIEYSHWGMINTPHTIDITDEKDIGWKLTEWYTSESKWLPDMETLPNQYPWESYVQKNNPLGTYAGTEEGTLVVKPEDPDNTLYLLYERVELDPDDDNGNKKVIKVYDNELGETEKVTGPDPVDGGTYTPPTEPGYKYTEIKVSENPPKTVTTWDDSEGGSKGNPPSIPVGEKDKTIYVHYEKDPNGSGGELADKKIVLYENELSYNYSLKDLVQNRTLATIFDDVPAPDVSYGPCGRRHHDRCDHSEDDYDCYSCDDDDYNLSPDNRYKVSVVDNFNQNSLSFIKDWTYTSPMSITGFAAKYGGNGANYKVTPQATFLLIRDKAKDVVTLYPGKNSSHLSELSHLGLSESYTSADTRKNNKRETDSTLKFFETVRTELSDASDRDTSLGWRSWMTPRTHAKTGTYYTSTAAGHSPEDANRLYSKTGNVEERYFLGMAGKGEADPANTQSDWQKKYKYNSTYANTSAKLSFYPYLKYSYYYKNSSTATPIMVTSSNLSEMKVFNAIQAGVYKKNEINANLDSTQWSTHQRSLTFLSNLGVSDKKSVLPGGAIQDLDMGNQGDTQIGVTVWQSCLPDSQVAAVQEGFKTSVSEAQGTLNTLKGEIEETIKGYGLVQWGKEGSSTEFKDILDGEELHESTGVSLVTGNGGSTSSDDKYYLRHDSTSSNRANFDVLGSTMKSVLYTVKSDTDGNVWVEKDGTKLASINRTQNASSLLSNAEIKLLDDNTKLITNYVSAIQRNAGSSRAGEKWHNEAFDGVCVLKTEMTFDVGFSQGGSKRTNVLDPLLTASSSSKSDLYNFSDDSKVRTSVYATTDISTTTTSDKQGYLGTLKGVGGMGDLETGLSDIQSFVHTKLFYIPNANVSDLN